MKYGVIPILYESNLIEEYSIKTNYCLASDLPTHVIVEEAELSDNQKLEIYRNYGVCFKTSKELTEYLYLGTGLI